MSLVDYDPDEHALVAEIREALGIEDNHQAYRTIELNAAIFEKETDCKIAINRFGDGVKVWRRVVDREQLEQFAAWFLERQEKNARFNRTLTSDPKPPASHVARTEIVRRASMMVYERLKRIGEEKGLPGLEEYAFFLLKHEDLKDTGRYNFGLALGDKKKEPQSGD